MTEKLRPATIHRVLHRPALVAGGDRELVIGTTVVCGFVGLLSGTVAGMVIAGLIWVAAINIYRMAAKADPRMRDKYIRHIGYRNYYPARSPRWTP